MQIPAYVTISILVGCIIYLWVSNKKAERRNTMLLTVLETTVWRLASLSRLIIATGESDLIDLADQILKADKERGENNETI